MEDEQNIDVSEIQAKLNNWLSRTIEKTEETHPVRDIYCKKCDTKLGFGLDGISYERVMVGAYHAIICTECVNDWAEHLYTGIGSNAYERYLTVERDINIVRNLFTTTGGDKVRHAQAELHPLYSKKDAIEKEIYTLAKAWVADTSPRTVPTP